MGNDTCDAQKDDPEQEDLLLKLSNDGLSKLQSSLSKKIPQHTFVSNNGKWLQIVQNGHKGSIFRGTRRIIDSKIPRQVVSLDEKYLRRCLELIHISASKSFGCSLSVNFVGSGKMGISSYHLDSPAIQKVNTGDVPRVVLEFPSTGGSGSTVICPTVAGYKSIMHMLDKPLLHKLGSLDIDPNSTTRQKDDIKEWVSCDVASSPSRFLLKLGEKDMMDSEVQNYQSENIGKRVVSVSSTDSTCFSSEHSSSSLATTIYQGTLRFTMNDNGMPRFAFSLDDHKEIYMASLSNAESGFNSGALEHTYLIHLRKGSGTELHLVGRINVSTLFSVSSSSSSRIMEREFVLFGDCGNSQIQCHDTRKNKGLPKKVVDAFKNTRASRQRSISRFSRASSIPDLCSWEPFQEPNYDLEPVNLLKDDLPPNLESSAIVVKEQIPEEQQEEELGGWGMKFLKKASLVQTRDASETSRPSTSMDVIIPSGIHGGPRKRNGGPSSLIQRWKSGGICDCGGWDLGCPLTILKGQPRKDQDEGECKLFELFTEGSTHGTPGLRIVNMNAHDGLYFVQFEPKISVLQSFSVAIAYIHIQRQRLRPSPAGKCTEA